MSERPTWVWAVVGSAVFHLGLVLVASVLPEGTRHGGGVERDELFTPGAVIEIETVAPQKLAVAEPSREPLIPPSAEELEAERPAHAPDDHPRSSDPAPDSGSEPPPKPTEAEPSERTGLFSGMRDSARPTTSGSGVVVDPSMLQGSRAAYHDSVENPGVGSGAVQGPAAKAKGSSEYAFKTEKGKRIYRDPGGRFIATLRADGRVDFRNKGAGASWTQIAIGDPGALLSTAAGEDPYARAKAKLLKATFELRIGMAVSFQKRQIKKRLRRLEKDLERIWTNEQRDLAARKELIFQRWDECEEPEDLGPSEVPGFAEIDTSELDEARQDAAGDARKTIEGFVRKHAPRGSAQAFTAAELADMNRRRVSKQKFSPY